MVPYGHGYKHETVQKYRNALYTRSLHTEILDSVDLKHAHSHLLTLMLL
jgi:hypothetical protein